MYIPFLDIYIFNTSNVAAALSLLVATVIHQTSLIDFLRQDRLSPYTPQKEEIFTSLVKHIIFR